MLLAVVAEVIEHYGGIFCDFVANGRFTVENSHGIAGKAVAAGVAELVLFTLKIGLKSLKIFLSAGRAADGIELKLDVFKSETLKGGVCHRNHLGVGRG